VIQAADLADEALAAPRLGDVSRLRAGDEVYAIGAPRKLAFTLSRGVVSYVGRELEGRRWLQVDMAINDGNSGGPVFTRDGELMGVMAFILRRSQGLSFAVPIGDALDAFPVLRQRLQPIGEDRTM
jgi:serine protease Do